MLIWTFLDKFNKHKIIYKYFFIYISNTHTEYYWKILKVDLDFN